MRNASNKDRRLVKGAIIGTAAIALLIGGGSFALWNDQASVSGGAVNSGELHFELTGTSDWTLNSTSIGASLGATLIVPGDVLTLTQPLAITADGTNLTANFTMDASGIVSPSLADFVLITYELTESSPGITGPTSGAYLVDGNPALTAVPATAVVTIDFPDTVTGLDGQDMSVDLTDVQFELVQINPTP